MNEEQRYAAIQAQIKDLQDAAANDRHTACPALC